MLFVALLLSQASSTDGVESNEVITHQDRGHFWSVTRPTPVEPQQNGFETFEFAVGQLDVTSRVRRAVELTDADRQAILDLHNTWRNNAALGNLNGRQKATRMKRMYWDHELEAHAKKFSRSCQMQHSSSVGFNELGYDFGENLYGSSQTNEPVTSGIDSWAEENRHYSHSTGRCAAGEVCGHYTAMVWETSTRVGCGITDCNGIAGWRGGVGKVLVCQYWRVGNWRGERPYTYSTNGLVGAQCEHAPDTSSQFPGLCTNPNSICDADKRCQATQACTPAATPRLNGQDTAYSCGAGACSFTQTTGQQVSNPTTFGNGMQDTDGSWVQCWQNRQECEDWCFAHKDATPACVGVTSSSQHRDFFFPVKTVARSQLQSASGGIVSKLQCSDAGAIPTARPTVSAVIPTARPTVSVAPPTARPTFSFGPAPTAHPTVSVAAPTARPTVSLVPPTAHPTISNAAPTARPTSTVTMVDGTPKYKQGSTSKRCPNGYTRMESGNATEQDCRSAALELNDSKHSKGYFPTWPLRGQHGGANAGVVFEKTENTSDEPNGCYIQMNKWGLFQVRFNRGSKGGFERDYAWAVCKKD